jgi:hypothetical protein
MFPFFDWTMVLLIPGIILALWAQHKTSSTFKKYSEIGSSRGITADQVAREILRNYGVNDVGVERIAGQLTDHYDPQAKTLRLSEAVYGNSSIAAIGVAAHEAGHAIQHAKGYAPIEIRNSIVPIANVGSMLSFPLLFIGLLVGASAHSPLHFLVQLGILLFVGVVVFHFVTLPVEFDASGRALKILRGGSFLTLEEVKGAKAVLTAAGMTYVASALMALLNLLRLLLISREN